MKEIDTDNIRYKCECPNCKKDIYVCKSIFHKMGYFDMGSGNCVFCSAKLRLTFNPEKEEMIAETKEMIAEIKENKKKVKVEVKNVVCDYGVFVNDNLYVICNSLSNAELIKEILEVDINQGMPYGHINL